MLYVEALKATNGDTTPATVIEAMSNMSLDTPTGKVTIVPYQTVFHRASATSIMLEVQKVGDVLTWVPVQTYPNVLLGTLDQVK